MAQKHLRELLQERQEPFQLKHYIADHRCQIGRSCPKTDLQVNKRKPVSKNPSFPSNFCESSCFFASHASPDPRKSPLFELRSPGKNHNRVFLHVPARTAAVLLEAAARIQNQSSKNAKSKVRNRGSGLGLFGSALKLLTSRNPTRQLQPVGGSSKIGIKLRLQNAERDRSSSETRRNAVSSERGLDSDSEPSSSSCRESFEEINGFGYGNEDAGEFSCYNSPFHFALQASPSSPGGGTPHFTSPVTSPTRRCTKDEGIGGTESMEKLEGQELEQDKEQCSPVSVLDPLSDEDRDEEDHRDNEADLDLHCSYEVIQRTKRRLLQKLRRFEQLAGLDSMEPDQEERDDDDDDDYDDEDDTITLYDSEEDLDDEFRRMDDPTIARDHVEENEIGKKNREVKDMRGSWKGFRFKDMEAMVGLEFRQDVGQWMKLGEEEVQNAAFDVELSIFSFLLEEFSLELLSCP